MIELDIIQEVLMVKRGKKELAPVLQHIASWMESALQLHLTYGYTKHELYPFPRTCLYLFIEDENKYYYLTHDDLAKYRVLHQDEIVQKFVEVSLLLENRTYENLYVVYKNIAQELREYVLNQAYIKFKKYIEELPSVNGCINYIGLSSPYLMVFYETDQDIKYNENNFINEHIRENWNRFVTQADEFGYCAGKIWQVKFDSYEHVKKDFEGNYFYYFR